MHVHFLPYAVCKLIWLGKEWLPCLIWLTWPLLTWPYFVLFAEITSCENHFKFIPLAVNSEGKSDRNTCSSWVEFFLPSSLSVILLCVFLSCTTAQCWMRFHPYAVSLGIIRICDRSSAVVYLQSLRNLLKTLKRNIINMKSNLSIIQDAIETISNHEKHFLCGNSNAICRRHMYNTISFQSLSSLIRN